MATLTLSPGSNLIQWILILPAKWHNTIFSDPFNLTLKEVFGRFSTITPSDSKSNELGIF